MGDLFLVKMLPDENQLDHAVSVFLVPVAHQSGLLHHQFDKVFFGSGGIP